MLMKIDEMKAAATLMILSSLLAAPAIAAEPGETKRPRLRATRTDAPPVIDGRLDEPSWAAAEPAGPFTQSVPDEGASPTERTEVRVLYDDRALYIGFFAAHRRASDIIYNELRRDFDGSSTDWVAVILDPFLDRRNGYQFGVNPLGATWDSQKSNEGRERNLSWDAVWRVRTTITNEGWFAEMEIPFRALQMPGLGEQAWGINFQRHLQGRLEDSYWSPVPRQYVLDRVSLAGTLEGLKGVASGRNLRIKPYVIARDERLNGASRAGAAAGVDVKYGLRPILTADLTVHTDFSQVEADVQQIGASRFSVRLPEKREFFLENSGVFQFGPGNDRANQISLDPGASAGGRDSGVNGDLALFFSRRIGLSAEGAPVPIDIGLRLSGRALGGRVGALYVRERGEEARPRSDFFVARGRREILGGSDIGFMFVARSRSTGGDTSVGGIDLNLRLSSNVRAYGYAATALAEDAGLESPPGFKNRSALRAGLSWSDSGWVADASIGSVGPRFRNDAGFTPRLGVNRVQGLLGRRFRPFGGRGFIREVYPAFGLTSLKDSSGSFDSRYTEERLLVTLRDGATVELGANPNDEALDSPFVVNGREGLTVAPGRYGFTDRFLALSTSRSKRLMLQARLSGGSYYDGERRVASLGLSGRFDQHLSGSLTLNRDRIEMPGGRAVTDTLVLRVNYGFSTRLFLNALVQYNSNSRRWDTNVRANFIHRPLSDIFLVFTDSRAEGAPSQRNRTLAFKVTRLLSF
ncbi:MAG: carbohydrate binding family 9 domain-containing protein [Vicinamibacteria bacterium]|nr:carbohydrate binding family 9 domain-containing protein [Vicinamibacteria bacterium]